jgi:RNA polymerase sigma-70 factor (ECF subfamily)
MEVSPKTIEAYISKALKVLRIELQDYLPFLLLFL